MTSTDPDDIIRTLILPKLSSKLRRAPGGWTACCPVPSHDDSKPSLSVGLGRDGKVVLHCFGGCEPDDVAEALGVTWKQLNGQSDDEELKVRPRSVWTPRGDAEAVYDYTDEKGSLLYQVLRTPNKEFPLRVPDHSAKSGWRWSLGNTRRVLYRLPEVIKAVAEGYVIYICEGEKDVHAVEVMGGVATCNPGGTGGGWRPEYSKVLAGAIVMIIADKDDAGRKHARKVAASCEQAGVATWETLEAAEGKDAADHLAAGHGLRDFVATGHQGAGNVTELAPDFYEFIGGVDPPSQWIIPDLLEMGERLIWTGPEGYGKTMVMRQLAVSAAAGFDPFWGAKFDPVRVLYVDCENPERLSRRYFKKFGDVMSFCDLQIPGGGLRIIHRPQGIDLLREDDAAWFAERVHAHKPQLLIVGPLYKMHATDSNEEQSVRALIGQIDATRGLTGCAVAIEAHAGHGETFDPKKRSVRPAGSSLFLRWPEFGYGLAPYQNLSNPTRPDREHLTVREWRGPRDERAWPKFLRRGSMPSEWPWVVEDGPHGGNGNGYVRGNAAMDMQVKD